MRRFEVWIGVLGSVAIASSVSAEERFNPPAALQTPPTHEQIILTPPPKSSSTPAAVSAETVHQLLRPQTELQTDGTTSDNNASGNTADLSAGCPVVSTDATVCPAVSSQANKLGGTTAVKSNFSFQQPAQTP